MFEKSALGFFCAFLLLALSSPFLPRFLIGKALILAGLAYATSWLLLPPSPLGEGLDSRAILGFLIVSYLVVGFAIAIRLAGEVIYRSFNSSEVRWDRNTDRLDRIIVAAAGVVGGIALVPVLGALMGGSAGGLVMDLTVGLISAALACYFYLRQRLPIDLGAAMLSLTVAIISFGGAFQTQNIIDDAIRLAQGRAWCLTMPNARDRDTTRADLGFYALPKDWWSPHLVLTISGEKQMLLWSVRRQEFGSGNIEARERCDPTKVSGIS
ncbi:hypothetical protein [Peteryoungia ipomoeae]|uniref:Uncharacterized protein n=1 Tax=Peteryoungia ipomoeae TaxID=1210932 RepID=A0A4S8P155_9HYPH|nr:hypothetical protein [Peteryoungia ipomoeae]THV21324.1 hypothetical protein FAA97_14970 [Peteryoungia ipomoeae]